MRIWESPKATGGSGRWDWGGSRRWVAAWRRLRRRAVEHELFFLKKNLKTETRLYRPFLSLENGKKGSVGEYIFCHLPSVKSRNTLQFEALLRFDFFSQEFYCNQTILSAYGERMRSRRNRTLNFENRLNFGRFRCCRRFFFLTWLFRPRSSLISTTL